MRKAGDYYVPFTWFIQSTPATTDSGAKPEVFTDSGTLWGYVVLNSGTESEVMGALQGASTGLVYLRQYPEVSVKDRLYDPIFESTYIITYLTWGDNETICQVTTYEEDILTDS